jgi:hypothetical protein
MSEGCLCHLWSDLLEDGGIIAVSTYEKYNGGLSPRDVLAMTRVLSSLSSHLPRRPIQARSFLAFQPGDWDSHLILIGGLLSNQVTRAMTRSQLRSLQGSFTLQREMLCDKVRSPGKNCLTPVYEAGLETNVAGVNVDYGLVTVQRNPMNLNKRLYMLAGIKGWGGLAAATVFSAEEYYEPLNRVLEQHFGMSPEDVRDYPLIEIVVRTEVGPTGAQGVRDLKSITVELVRVDGDASRQWVAPDSCLRWGPMPHVDDSPDPGRPPGQLSLSLNDRVGIVELNGIAFAVRFEESRLTPRELDRFDYDIVSMLGRPDWRMGAKSMAERLSQVLPEGFTELLRQMQAAAVQPEHSRVRFVSPRDYLRAPFELLRTERDYLVLEYPVFRAIADAFSSRTALSPTFIENLRLRNIPLRVLLVASDPHGRIAHDVDQEIETIFRIFDEAKPSLKVLVEVAVILTEDATAARVRDCLQNSSYHVFHYAGHSAWNPDNPEQSGLLVRDERGAETIISAAQLAAWTRHSDLRFCFLSSCEGTRSDTEHRLLHYDFLGLADALIQAGLPEALGFRWPVSSPGALRLAASFYRTLLSESSFNIERAVLMARCQMAERDRDDLTWLSPILIAQK